RVRLHQKSAEVRNITGNYFCLLLPPSRAAMVAATPATIDTDYSSAKRSREYSGEGYRWYDLARTHKWAEVAATYEIGGINYGDHSPEKVTRTIEPYHYLRPIPQGQIERLELSPDELRAYQNSGYN